MDDLTATVETVGDGVNPSQETQVTSQEVSKPQSDSVTQVEANGNNAQAVETQRRKPSDFYKERDRYRRLDETVRNQSRQMEEIANLLKEMRKPAVSAEEKFDKEKFWNDPESALTARDQKHRAEVQELKQGLDQIRNQSVESQKASSMREGLELLFPKSSADSNETLEQRIRKDPEYAEKVQEILNSPAISKLAEIDPKSAAELARIKIDAIKPPQSPKVIPKGLMGSTARGNPGGGKVTVESKMSELRKLTAEVESNPSLRYDEKHKAARASLMREVETLMQEKRA